MIEGDLPNRAVKLVIEWAMIYKTEYGFTPRRDAYVNKCDLCNDIRWFLVEAGAGPFAELAPKGYYKKA